MTNAWPLMVAAVLTLIWRQFPSVFELARILNPRSLWPKATKVSRQTLAPRFLGFPAASTEAQMAATQLPSNS